MRPWGGGGSRCGGTPPAEQGARLSSGHPAALLGGGGSGAPFILFIVSFMVLALLVGLCLTFDLPALQAERITGSLCSVCVGGGNKK